MMRGALLCLLLMGAASAHAQDRDGDGRADELDLCPEIAEGVASLFPGDGCPDADADRDRIVDDYDFCPSARETVNDFEDADGCPDVEGSFAQSLADRIHFAIGSHDLNHAALMVVARLAAWLEAHPEVTHAQVVGRADERGNAAANQLLSLRRATRVRDALIGHGVASSRLSARGLGALPGTSAALRMQNRRVELHVALAGQERDAVDLSRFTGVYLGDSRMDLRVGSTARDVASTLHPIESGAQLTAYAGRIVDDRLVLVLAGAGREETLVLRLEDERAFGVVEARTARSTTHAAWTAHHESFFDQSAVARAIRAHMAEIQACYETELGQEVTLRGRVAVTMTVMESGETANVHVAQDTLTPPRPALGSCVVQIVDAWEFRPGPTGGSVSFTFPFVFEPQN